MNNIKNDILSVAIFTQNRPDMSSYDNNTIQSAIFQTSTFLNARCNGMIGKVWYVTDPNSQLFRNIEEKDFILEAFIVQTQYTLNMGNDFSVGSESLSIGSLSGSFQRPVERKEIAPGVDTLLQAARVFFFQEFSLLKSNECNSNGEREDLENYVTTNFADNRYLAKVQPNAQKGSVATIGESNQIVFSNPTEISFSYINANKIYDPATKDEFKIINEVENIAFFGMNFSGPYSAVRRGELYNLLAYTTMNWRDDFEYKKDTIIQYAYLVGTNWVVQNFLALADNKNKNPLTSPLEWQALGAISADINKIVDIVMNNITPELDTKFTTLRTELLTNQATFETFITTQFETFKTTITTQQTNFEQTQITQQNTFINTTAPDLIRTEIEKQLDALPTANIGSVVYAKDTWYHFYNLDNFRAVKQEFNVLDNEYEESISYGSHLLGFSFSAFAEGSDFITKEHLPNDRFNLRDTSTDLRNGQIFFHRSNGEGNATGPYPIVRGFWNSNSVGTSNQYFIQMNNGTQQKFIPKFVGTYIVRFKRDLVRTQQAIVKTNAIWGKIEGTLADQYDLNTNLVDKDRKIRANRDNIAINEASIITANTNITTNTNAIATTNAKVTTNTTKIDTNITNIMLNTASIGDLTTKIDKSLVVNVEYVTNDKLGTKPIYAMLVQKGNLKNNVDIAASGDIIASGVDLFLGIEYGVISRKNNLQIHNINAINNAPDQHSSIIYQTGSKISWFFATSMVLTSFKNRPFLALIKYTKE